MDENYVLEDSSDEGQEDFQILKEQSGEESEENTRKEKTECSNCCESKLTKILLH
jgi:hypothetical protein